MATRRRAGNDDDGPAAGAVPGAPRASSPRAPSRLALARDLPARVYIEHTDAYRVVYHANYFKFMRRAREAIFFGEPTTTPDRSPAADDPTNDDGWLSGWADAATVVAVDACRFASPLVLGDDLVVRTRVLAAGARTLAVRQVVRLRAEDAPERLALAADVVVVPLDDARRPVAVPRALRDRLVRGEENDGISEDAVEHASGDPAWLFGGASEEDASDDPSDASTRSGVSSTSTDASSTSGGKTVFSTRVTLFESELSDGGWASEADVLRWFERNRTDAIGGSDALARLETESGVSVVVSAMAHARFHPGPLAGAVGFGSETIRFGSDGDEEAATPTPTPTPTSPRVARVGASHGDGAGPVDGGASAAEPAGCVFADAGGGGGGGGGRRRRRRVDDRGVPEVTHVPVAGHGEARAVSPGARGEGRGGGGGRGGGERARGEAAIGWLIFSDRGMTTTRAHRHQCC